MLNDNFDLLFNDRQSSISIVIASMDRTDNLIKSLEACIHNKNISEIIVLDYGSEIPIEQIIPINIKNQIKLYRINATYWHLSRAYNIAIQLSSSDIIVKLDADYLIDHHFFDKNHICKNEFISGFGYKDSLSGFLMIHKEDFLKINGYNERIIIYGYDDDDINYRLKKYGFKLKPLDRSVIKHLPHNKDRKVWFKNNHNSIIGMSRSQAIRHNKIIASTQPWTNNDKLSRYHKISGFVACMNRQENLLSSLHSWIDTKYFDEIIILDYGSSPPLINIEQYPIVKLYRESAKFWHLTKAYNIASQLTTGDIIVKLDSDYLLDKYFFSLSKQQINEKEFLTGHGCNIQSLWGFLMVYRNNFFGVNGYNERLIGWGHDDIDINQRLKNQLIKPKIINTKYIRHIPHNQDKNAFIENPISIYESQKNNIQKLANNPWTKNDIMSSLNNHD
jgi:predicted glycosyltransferase involved in capsule biosynthesis